AGIRAPGGPMARARARPWPRRPPAGMLAPMTEPGPDTSLSRTAASEAVRDIGWRYLLGTLALSVPVPSLAQATEVASAALTASGTDADGHLRLDLRPDRAELSLQTRALGEVPGRGGPDDAIVDPAGQGPAIWFQQMDAPRPQRNRVHFDITVADDEADARVRAALGAGGRLVDDSFA